MESLLRISPIIILSALALAVPAEENAPNIVLVLTDDQDVVLKGLVCASYTIHLGKQ